MLETYRGEALAWEADDLGHTNMRFYVERTEQARIQFFAHLGLPRLFQVGALSTLASTHYHINYHSEVKPGQGLWVETGIATFEDSHMVLEHRIYKTPGTLAATVVETVSHISSRTRKPFPWPKRVVENAQAFIGPLSEEAGSRNIDLDAKPGTPTMKRAETLGLTPIGRGAFSPAECDVFGTVRPYAVFGRVSDSVQHLKTAWPDIKSEANASMSGALLEARCIIRKMPKAGDVFVVCSGLMDINTHVRTLCHWLLDPISGTCYMSFVGVACLFDLESRKLVKIDAAEVTALKTGVIKDLAP